MASSSRLPVRRERGRHEGIKTWGSPDMRRQLRWQVYRFEPQNQAAAGLPVWVSKPDGGRFARLGLRTGGASCVAEWQLRRACGVITMLASS